MKWIECHECTEEFRVICDSVAAVRYCPLCGEEVQEDEDIEDEDYD